MVIWQIFRCFHLALLLLSSRRVHIYRRFEKIIKLFLEATLKR
uniref:Uncharacterized protein n=1 Tax=Arundo donax TaxID=35708 RepID=A0A0A9C5F8_ARUDO